MFRLAGRLSPSEFDTLLASVNPCLDGERNVEIDLSGLRFLDEEAARLLCDLRTRGVTITHAYGYVGELLHAVEKER